MFFEKERIFPFKADILNPNSIESSMARLPPITIECVSIFLRQTISFIWFYKIHNWWKVKKHCFRGSHESAGCVGVLILNFLRPDSFYDVFLDGEPIWGWKISGDSALNCNLFRSYRKFFHSSLTVTLCVRWCQVKKGPWPEVAVWWRGRCTWGGRKLNTRAAPCLLYLSLNIPEVIEFILVH